MTQSQAAAGERGWLPCEGPWGGAGHGLVPVAETEMAAIMIPV